jgi:hypothetical protein
MLRAGPLPFGHWPVLAVLLAILTAGLAGCGKDSTAPAVVVPGPPAPVSPASVLLALKWAAERKDFDVMSTLYSDDFVFVFAPEDSAGSAYRDTPWTREDEMAFWQHLFTGGSTEPAADQITLDFTNPLHEFPSSILGHHPTWHREIRAEANLRIQRGDGTIEVRGPSLFFFVRGDSAMIPQDLIDGGFGPDSTRWWIQGWVDETIGSAAPAAALRGPGPARPQPIGALTWGAVKVLYR